MFSKRLILSLTGDSLLFLVSLFRGNRQELVAGPLCVPFCDPVNESGSVLRLELRPLKDIMAELPDEGLLRDAL
ncbi:hypothetical protein B0T24DRAFT_616908 [Lasiosphaeria ovina]|uniref:Uncharacterized protein n=1 Tax=Lasiosphaeria ovina TaxID=92902 RepID=A0AAE0KH57_9PEZI|nr:hypothetical protein B0T24DRAFT_616908 [Lasiosphaeria ovina]